MKLFSFTEFASTTLTMNYIGAEKIKKCLIKLRGMDCA